MRFDAKVITVSDSVATGTATDLSGPTLVRSLESLGFTVVAREVVADGVDEVANALRAATSGFCGLIVTTGGTGFAPRDVTPEATRLVIEREAPGLSEIIRRSSERGALSRGVSGTSGQALIVNLPGSPRGAEESLEAIASLLQHAVELLSGINPHPRAKDDGSSTT